MLMFSRNGNTTNGDIHGSNSNHATPQHHRLSTSSAAMMSPRGIYLSVNSSNDSPRAHSKRHSVRNSYYDSSNSKGSTKAAPIPSNNKEHQNGPNGQPPTEHKTSMFKRSTSRSTMKKNRPHSWHSTLQKGFNRARSRSKGREEREHRKEEKEQHGQNNSSNNKGRRSYISAGSILKLLRELKSVKGFANWVDLILKMCYRELNTHYEKFF